MVKADAISTPIEANSNIINAFQKTVDRITPNVLKQARNRAKLLESKGLFKDMGRVDEIAHRNIGQSTEQIRPVKLPRLSEAESLALTDALEGNTKAFSNKQGLRSVRKMFDNLFAEGHRVGLFEKVGRRKDFFP